MSSGAIRAGRAFVELFTDDSKFVRGLKSAEKRLRAFSKNVTALGTKFAAIGSAVVAPMLAAVGAFVAAGDALDKMSGRIGVSVEFLSALSHAANLGGTSIDVMEGAIRRLQRTAYDATRGLTTAQDGFAALGVSVMDSSGQLKGTEQLFRETAGALANVTNETKKAALATMVFGRAGTQMLPMLNNGAEGLNAAMEEAKALGIVMSGEDATSAAVLADSWERLTSSLKMAIVKIGGKLAPLLTSLADRIVVVVRPVLDWIDRNKELIPLIFKVAAGAIAAGAALIAVGMAANALASVFTMLITGTTILVGVMVAVGKAIAFLVSPIGLVTAALVGLAAYFIDWSKVAKSTTEYAGNLWEKFRDRALAAWQGVRDALQAGDMKLAFRIVVLALKAEWIRFTGFLKGKWTEFTTIFQTVWSNAVFGMASAFVDAWALIQTVGLKVWNVLADEFDVFTMHVRQGWNTTVSWFAAKWAKLKSLVTDEADESAEIEAIAKRENARFRREARESIVARREGMAKELEEIEGMRAGSQQELADAQSRADEKRFAEMRAALASNDADLEKAQAELDAAIAEARRKRREKEREANSKDVGETPTLANLFDDSDVGNGPGAGARTGVRGSFSAFQAAAFGATTTAEDRIAMATEQTARNTKDTVQVVKDSRPKFVR